MIIALTTVSCGKEASLSVAIDDLNYDSLPAKSPRPTKPAEKLHAAVVELKELLAVQSSKNLTEKQAEQARKARAAVAGNLAAVEKQFAADRKKLGNLDAKAALKRLAVIETKTDEIKSDLIDALAVVPKSGEKTASARAAIKQLTALSPDKPQQPLSSDLSFGIKNAKPRSVSLSAGITPAYQAPSPGTEPSTLPREPEPADLEETDETKITPAIEQLATELDHDPVKIYEYVRNNIKFEPYYGIRKGADQTLAEKAGSDADQAALLIALMRESGVPARFVQGVAELPAAKAANWLGVDVANGERMDAVPEILWSGGIPTTPIRANGALTKVRFAHFWAEAHLPSDAYRGVNEADSSSEWVALDTSIKQIEMVAPSSNAVSLLEPAITEWADELVGASEGVAEGAVRMPDAEEARTANERLIDAATTIVGQQGAGSLTVEDLLGSRDIVRVAHNYVPSSMAFRSVLVASEHRGLPDQLFASIEMSVSGSDPLSAQPSEGDQAAGFSFRATAPELANRRLTVGYVSATDADEEILDAYHGLLNSPSYAASLIPVLRIDGALKARGHSAVSTGFTQNFTITYRMPGFASDVVENPIYVGSLSAISLDVGDVSVAQLKARGQRLGDGATVNSENVLTDRNLGEVLSGLGSLYFYRNDTYNSLLGQVHAVSQHRQLSGAITATNIEVASVASFPVATRFTGLSIDVDRDAQTVVPLTSDEGSTQAFTSLTGFHASSSEGNVLSVATRTAGISTSSVFSAAAEQGIELVAISAGNVGSVLQSVDVPVSVREEVRAAVTSGAEVLIPRRAVTLEGWSGTAYVVQRDGASDFRIVGGASGGYSGLRPGDEGFAESVAAQQAYADYIESLKTECRPDLVAVAVIALLITAVFIAYFGGPLLAALAEGVEMAEIMAVLGEAKAAGAFIGIVGLLFAGMMDPVLDCLDRY